MSKSTSTPVSTEYEGRDELELMVKMPGYNAYVARILADPVPAGARVADFGAGLGAIVDRLAGYDTVCIEVDPHLRGALEAKGYRVVSRASELPAGSLDAVVSSNVLEHIDDDVGALRELRAVLRPGGVFTTYVPAFPILWTTLDDRVGHCRRYTRSSLASRFTQAGFEVVTTRYADSLGGILALLFKVVGSADGSLRAWQLVLFDRVVFPLSQLLDLLFSRFFGKNVYLVAKNPTEDGARSAP